MSTSEINWEKRAEKAEHDVEKLQKEVDHLKELTENKTVVLEQRAKIDTRTNILRMSIGLNTGMIAGLLVHFLAGC